ncbi:MAG: hypothetical protein V7647_3070, partial [Acidobacteriota bacterium]
SAIDQRHADETEAARNRTQQRSSGL